MNPELNKNPLASTRCENKDIFEVLNQFNEQNYNIFILNETGKDYYKQLPELKNQNEVIFVVGNQSGDFINSKELIDLNLPNLSLGNQSFLASSILRLIKMSLLS